MIPWPLAVPAAARSPAGPHPVALIARRPTAMGICPGWSRPGKGRPRCARGSWSACGHGSRWHRGRATAWVWCGRAAGRCRRAGGEPGWRARCRTGRLVFGGGSNTLASATRVGRPRLQKTRLGTQRHCTEIDRFSTGAGLSSLPRSAETDAACSWRSDGARLPRAAACAAGRLPSGSQRRY
jgi:hypothetical protein